MELREPLCPTATMTKRKIQQQPSTQQAGQPPTKCINVEEHTDYGGTNLIIDSLVQVISQLHMESEDDTLAHALSTILLHAPSAGMKTLPECKELIMANPDLKQTLQTAINLHCYEDVMSLRRHLRDSVSFSTYNHLPASDSSKRSRPACGVQVSVPFFLCLHALRLIRLYFVLGDGRLFLLPAFRAPPS